MHIYFKISTREFERTVNGVTTGRNFRNRQWKLLWSVNEILKVSSKQSFIMVWVFCEKACQTS